MGSSVEARVKMEDRIEAAFRKWERGEHLTEQDWVLIQYTRGAGTCHACAGPGVGVGVRGLSSAAVAGGAR